MKLKPALTLLREKAIIMAELAKSNKEGEARLDKEIVEFFGVLAEVESIVEDTKY
jgi:hypothetical protein